MKAVSHAVGRWRPIVLSAMALLLVLTVLATGPERGLKDEGAAAHIWQILMALQIPLIVASLATANWRQPGGVAKILALQATAFGLALAPVVLFRL